MLTNQDKQACMQALQPTEEVSHSCMISQNLHLTLTVLFTVHMPPLDGRLIQLWLYGRSHPDDNHYSHPIDVVVLVDLNLKKVGSYLLPPCVMTDNDFMHELFDVHDISRR